VSEPSGEDPDAAADPLRQDPSAVATLDGLRAGLGGHIRERPEDFLVEEVPLFEPSGRGDHTIAQIEKRGTSTFDALLFLSKTCKVSERVIGYGGLKDARAVARQFVSLPKVSPERVLGVNHRKFRVLSAVRNEKPLRIGQLRGNRFTIRIRGANLARVDAAREVLETLVRRGMPNAYGGQRYGTRLDGHLLGRAVVREDWAEFVDQLLGRPSPLEKNPQMVAARGFYDEGDYESAFDAFPLKHRTEKKATGILLRGGSPREVFDALGSGPRRIWVSAWQSYLFNRVLDRRVRDGTFDKLLEGDIAWLHESSASYPVRDEAAERERARTCVASPTGPLLGYDPTRPQGLPGALEREILASEGAVSEAFEAPHCRARGLRRPLRCPIEEASLDTEPGDVVVARFFLPPGAFATVLLEHLMSGAEASGSPTPAPGADCVPQGE
jgi:tRNA pseudouridine13 synthase